MAAPQAAILIENQMDTQQALWNTLIDTRSGLCLPSSVLLRTAPDVFGELTSRQPPGMPWRGTR